MTSTLDYPFTERVLDNGLRVIVSPDHATPSVAVNLWYDVGSRHEAPGKTGFAHLFEHIMFEGSAHVRAGEHIAAMQAAGASVNATTWFDRTNYFESLPVGGLELALWLEADRMATLLDALTRENLDNQREVVKEEKRQRYDNVPYGDVMERLIALLFPPDHPYGHTTIGSMADLDAASLDDVRDFFAGHYMPNNAVLSLVGDVEPEEGFALVEKYLGPVPRRDRTPAPVQPELPPLSGLPRAETTAAVPADAVYFGWRLPAVGTVGFDAAQLAISVLGEGQTSRLHQRLVRRDELAQSAGAGALGLIGGNSYALGWARCHDGIDPHRAEEALITELDRLATDGPTAEELELAGAQFERQWLQTMAMISSRADQLSGMATLLDQPGRINTRIDEIAAIGIDQVAAAARDLLTPERRATLVFHKEAA